MIDYHIHDEYDGDSRTDVSRTGSTRIGTRKYDAYKDRNPPLQPPPRRRDFEYDDEVRDDFRYRDEDEIERDDGIPTTNNKKKSFFSLSSSKSASKSSKATSKSSFLPTSFLKRKGTEDEKTKQDLNDNDNNINKKNNNRRRMNQPSIKAQEEDTYNKQESENDNKTTSYNPIDYKFPSKAMSSSSLSSSTRITNNNDDDDQLPQTGWDSTATKMKPDEIQRRGEKRGNYRNQQDDNRIQQRQPPPKNYYANPRKDAVSRYTSTKMGKIKLSLSSASIGGMAGAFIGKSMLNNGKLCALIFGFLFWFMSTFLRNAYGEMSRSLGLTMIFLLSRTRNVRKRYKTGCHVKAICRIGRGGRVPFPPILDDENGNEGAENPWKYTPQSDQDPDFDMIKSLICIALVGSFCGGNVPLIPTWIGSASGAAALAFMGIGKNARGDLIRTMGMRVVALVGETMDINEELNVGRKVAVVAGKLLDKALILDRKHRIKDRVFSGVSWAYEKISSTVNNAKDDMGEEESVIDTKYRDRRQPEGRKR